MHESPEALRDGGQRRFQAISLEKTGVWPHTSGHGCNSGNLEAFWTRVRFPPPPPKCSGHSGLEHLGGGVLGFDRADKGEQATRQAIDVNEANP